MVTAGAGAAKGVEVAAAVEGTGAGVTRGVLTAAVSVMGANVSITTGTVPAMGSVDIAMITVFPSTGTTD